MFSVTIDYLSYNCNMNIFGFNEMQGDCKNIKEYTFVFLTLSKSTNSVTYLTK